MAGIQSIYLNDLPRGAIIDFYGKMSDIPAGWFLCDGKNGTPNLINKFARGCSSDSDVGKESGYDTTQMPSLNFDVGMSLGRGGAGWAQSNNTGSYFTTCQEALSKETTKGSVPVSIRGNDKSGTNHPPCVMLLKIMKS
ncbi:hypothetical protein [Chromobacterium piscinae]|uniref:hypothetical protein n=1 Tax=Chromobacterium piscinae TaxID=686831 RepID=UPI003208058A